jgi:hypothetical protein
MKKQRACALDARQRSDVATCRITTHVCAQRRTHIAATLAGAAVGADDQQILRRTYACKRVTFSQL